MTFEDGETISYQSGWSFVFGQIRRLIYTVITGRSMDVFMRPSDTISSGPSATGVYEQQAVDFFRRCSALGYDDFFIDIGANIGLTSYLAAPHFSQLYAFEPNPLAFKLLEVNIACSNNDDKFKLFNCALGAEDGVISLVIPKKNWGGAYIDSPDNSYGEDVLLMKDNFKKADSNNYIKKKVKIRQGAIVFREIFEDLREFKRTAGVIKIDVEGFELSVIRQIGKALPREFSVYILFENWDPSLDASEFTNPFKGRASLFRLGWKSRAQAQQSRRSRKARFLAGLPFGISNLVYRLTAIGETESELTGDVVMHVASSIPGDC